VIAVDTGILLCAVNRHTPEHARAVAALESLAHGERPWAIAWPCIYEFLAFVTHPHAVVRPLRPADAWGVLHSLAASPSLRWLGPGPAHLAAAEDALAHSEGVRDSTGLAIAAILREHGVREVLSADRALRRFRFLEVIDPLHGPTWSPGLPPARRYRSLQRRGTR